MRTRQRVILIPLALVYCLVLVSFLFMIGGCRKDPTPVQPVTGSPEYFLVGVWQSEESESSAHRNRVYRLRLAYGQDSKGESVLYGTWRSWLWLPKEGIENQVTQVIASDFDDPTNPITPVAFSKSEIVPDALRESMFAYKQASLLSDTSFLLSLDKDNKDIAYLTDPSWDVTVRLVRRTEIGVPAHEPTTGFAGYAALERHLNP